LRFLEQPNDTVQIYTIITAKPEGTLAICQ